MKKLLLISLGVLIVAGFVIYQDPQLRAYFTRTTEQVLPSAVTEQTLYRWRDKHGQWQLSDKPPPAGVDYETVQYPANTNVIPSERLTGKKSD
jgi:hypothetical protein